MLDLRYSAKIGRLENALARLGNCLPTAAEAVA